MAPRKKLILAAYDLKGAIDELGQASQDNGWCIPGTAATAYACLVAAHLGEFDDDGSLEYFPQVMEPIFRQATHVAAACAAWFLSGAETLYRLARFQAIQRDFRKDRFTVAAALRRSCLQRRLRREPLALCGSGASLIGRCEYESTAIETLEMFYNARGTAASNGDVTLCSHVPLHDLSSMVGLFAWKGEVSVSIWADGVSREDSIRLTTAWVRTMRQRRHGPIRVSLTLEQNFSTQPRRYPASLLRKIAVNAATSTFVLLCESGFVPSAQLGNDLQGWMMAGVTNLLQAGALLVLPAFEVEAISPWKALQCTDLEKMVRNSTAASYDRRLCPLRKFTSWQWTFLDGPTQSRRIPSSDLLLPGLLAKPENLHFPLELHGLATSDDKSVAHRQSYCQGLPKGIRATLDYADAHGLPLLQLPRHFVWRRKGFEPNTAKWTKSTAAWQELEIGRADIDLDLMYGQFLHRLWAMKAWGSKPQLPSAEGLEPVEHRTPKEWLRTLKMPPRLHLVLPATSMFGSAWMDRLVENSPWPVHVVALGAESFWSTMLQEMPHVLSSDVFQPEDVVMVVDAYDMFFAHCEHDIIAEYYRHGKPLLVSAEKICFPKWAQCLRCHNAICEATGYRYLNSGGVLGTPASLLHAYSWMAGQAADPLHTDKILGDDQGAWHFYQQTFPERVALEHDPRIWLALQGTDITLLQVQTTQDRCGIVSWRSSGSEVCFLHGNGRTGHLWQLVQRVDASCGRKPMDDDGRTGGLRVYDGFASARFQTKQVVVKSSQQHRLLSKLFPA